MDTYDFEKAARLIQEYEDTKIKTIIGREAVKWFQANFEKGGFHDKGVKKWTALSEKYAKRRKDGKILKQSGNLQNSIDYEETSYGVLIYADEPYAKIHNEGGRITGIFQVNEHYRKDTAIKAHTRKTKHGTVSVKAHTRSGGVIKEHTRNVDTVIPQRQFMGNSHALMEHLEAMIAQDIKDIIDSCGSNH